MPQEPLAHTHTTINLDDRNELWKIPQRNNPDNLHEVISDAIVSTIAWCLTTTMHLDISWHVYHLGDRLIIMLPNEIESIAQYHAWKMGCVYVQFMYNSFAYFAIYTIKIDEKKLNWSQ